MTDTTDIKALRELAFNASMAITRLSANGEECLYAIGEDTQIDKDVELSNQFHKAFNPIVVIYLLDQLEAERQRADELKINWDAAKNSIQFYKAEIAAMKGDQVPVAYLYSASFERGEVEGQLTDAPGCDMPVYDRPQKPVVLPKSHYVCGCADRYMSEKEVKAAIKAAGGIVKDGE